MLIYVIIYLFITLVYTWTNIWSLGFLGVTAVIYINSTLAIIYLFVEFYYFWLYDIINDNSFYLWAELGNNVFIFFNIKIDLFSYILSLIITFGYFFVINFVFIDLSDDKESSNFIIMLGIFAIFMYILTISGNLLVFYLGWEGIGLTSLILITFWSERTRSIKASFKIFFINKIGDYIIFMLLCICINLFGDIDFDVINSQVPLFLNNYFYLTNINIIEILGILLVLGSSIKSAQYGFHIWLLEAMEAPLGASALMHSSTLVVGGFVLIFRLSSILDLSTYAQILMFLMGSFSATFGSLFACFQYELKVIMAYSTISNMGLMFLLLSIGSYFEAVFVLVIHAFIKIFMFLVVGSIILNCGGCQDIRWMGGLLMYNPGLWALYTYGGFCLIGLPYLSGYYYKQFILTALSNSFLLFRGAENILILSFFFTSIYITRSSYLIFLGSKCGHRKIYKKKITSLGIFFDLFFLSTIIFFFYFMILNVLYTSNQIIGTNIFSQSFFFINYRLYDINFSFYIQWFICYWFKVLIFIYWCYWTHYLKWSPLFYFYFFNTILFFKFVFNIIYVGFGNY